MKTLNKGSVLPVLGIAVATASWGGIDIGSEALAQLLFSTQQQLLPAFMTAFLRFALATIVILAIFCVVFCRRYKTVLSILCVPSKSGSPFWVLQSIYGIIWGASISFFVMALQKTQAGEFVFVCGLCLFAIFNELVSRKFKLDDAMLAHISFNVLIMICYLYGKKGDIFIDGEEATLLSAVILFVFSYSISFDYKSKKIPSDDYVKSLLTLKVSRIDLHVIKMLIQFFTATVIALILMFCWQLDDPTEFIDLNIALDLTNASIVAAYMLFGTVGSYFLFNSAIEKLNKLSLSNSNTPNGGQVASYFAALEPITAVLLSLSVSASGIEFYLVATVLTLILYMLYIKERQQLKVMA